MKMAISSSDPSVETPGGRRGDAIQTSLSCGDELTTPVRRDQPEDRSDVFRTFDNAVIVVRTKPVKPVRISRLCVATGAIPFRQALRRGG
jgi:hypothetical protein